MKEEKYIQISMEAINLHGLSKIQEVLKEYTITNMEVVDDGHSLDKILTFRVSPSPLTKSKIE